MESSLWLTVKSYYLTQNGMFTYSEALLIDNDVVILNSKLQSYIKRSKEALKPNLEDNSRGVYRLENIVDFNDKVLIDLTETKIEFLSSVIRLVDAFQRHGNIVWELAKLQYSMNEIEDILGDNYIDKCSREMFLIKNKVLTKEELNTLEDNEIENRLIKFMLTNNINEIEYPNKDNSYFYYYKLNK